MEITAELVETKQTKRVSLDNIYTLKFVTDNPMVMDLGKLGSDTVFKVLISISK